MPPALRIDRSDLDDLALRSGRSLAELVDDMRGELFADVGAALESSTKERFETKADPDGREWVKWSDAHAARQARRYPAASKLVTEGRLRDDVEPHRTGDTVVVGAATKYAAVHQFGFDRLNIPARPYLGLSSDDEADLQALIDDLLERAI